MINDPKRRKQVRFEVVLSFFSFILDYVMVLPSLGALWQIRKVSHSIKKCESCFYSLV